MALEKGLPAVPRGQSREMTAYLQALHNVIAGLSGFGRNSDESRAARVSEVRRIARNTGRETGSVVTSVLAAGAVTESRLANGAVSAAKLATNAVETRHISPLAVTREKIADRSISSEKLEAGSVNSTVLAAGAVTESRLASGAVSAAKLATNAVQTRHISAQAVTGEKIADKAVTREKIADRSISGEKLDAELLPAVRAGSAKHGETVTLGKFTQAPFVAMTYQSVPIGSCGELVCGIANLREEDGAWRFDVKAAFEMGNEDGFTVYPGEIGWMAIGLGAQE